MKCRDDRGCWPFRHRARSGVIEPRASPRASSGPIGGWPCSWAWYGWRPWARPLFNPDEGRYAEIPREMLSGGDWVIPHLNGLDYIEKPPLQFWATALSYRLLGPSEFAARFYTALTRPRHAAGGGRCCAPAVGPASGMACHGGVVGHVHVRGAGPAAHSGHEPDVLHDREFGGIRAGANRGTVASMADAVGVGGSGWACSPRVWSPPPSRPPCCSCTVCTPRFFALAQAAACQGAAAVSRHHRALALACRTAAP